RALNAVQKNGDIMTGNLFLKNDDRMHFAIFNEDGNARMWLYKDKDGDGIRINNGADGGGEFIFHKNGEFYSPAALHAGGATVGTDGNVNGSVWGGWLNNWLNSAFASRDNNINSRATWDYVNQNFVRDIRQSGIMTLGVGSNANTQTPAGGVVIGAIVHGNWDNNEELKYTWLQKNINGTWYNAGRE
ncbi:TPA: hypothetical protein G9F26_004549, partial [Salmonella enterica]|nr:hypothetical protein [Salmonella enterica]